MPFSSGRIGLSSRAAALYEVRHSSHRTLSGMEGLRGAAVLFVFFVHYTALVRPWIASESWTAAFADKLGTVGNVGVDLFFVLSGYLIYGTLIRREQPFRRYLRRRIERIYPPFLAVFVAYLFLSFLFPHRSRLDPDLPDATLQIISNLLLLPGIFPIEPIITVAWSLSYEAFFYLAVPLVIGATRMRSWSPACRLALFAGLGLVGLLAPSAFGGHVRMVMFLAGMIIFECREAPRAAWLDAATLMLLLGGIVAQAALADRPDSLPFRVALLAGGFGLLCDAVFRTGTITERIFSWTPLRWLGNCSYSFYLAHGLALHGFFLVLSRLWPPNQASVAGFWVLFPPAFATAFVISSALFASVERPFSLAGAPRRAAPLGVDNEGLRNESPA